jgi:hypothetical protein
MKLLLAAAIAVAATTSALADSRYCMPKGDGADRIPKTAVTCPDGYFASGQCCEALHPNTPRAFPQIKGASCRSGTFASGGSCKEFR